MAFEKSTDIDGKVILVRQTSLDPIILYPKYYSDSNGSMSYFFESIGNFDKADRGWKYYYCMWTDDPNRLIASSDFGFQSGETYISRCGHTYPLCKTDKRRRLILPV